MTKSSRTAFQLSDEADSWDGRAAFVFDHARIHLSLGLSNLRLDNIIENDDDGWTTDIAAPQRFSSRGTQSESSRRPLPLRRSPFRNAPLPLTASSTDATSSLAKMGPPGKTSPPGETPKKGAPAKSGPPAKTRQRRCQ